MNILEREIEDIIFAAITCQCETRVSDHGLDIQDFPDEGVFFKAVRQLKINSNGITDIVTVGAEWVDECHFFVIVNVIELKRGKLGYSELGQLCRYMQAVKRTFAKCDIRNLFVSDVQVGAQVRGVLIGNSIETDGDFVYTLGCMKNVDLYTYSLDFDYGIWFERMENNWHVIGEDLLDGELPTILKEAYTRSIKYVRLTMDREAAPPEEPSGASVDSEGKIVEEDNGPTT